MRSGYSWNALAQLLRGEGGAQHHPGRICTLPPPSLPCEGSMCTSPCTRGGCAGVERGNYGGRCPASDSISALVLWEGFSSPTSFAELGSLVSLRQHQRKNRHSASPPIFHPSRLPSLFPEPLRKASSSLSPPGTRSPWNPLPLEPLPLEPPPPGMPSPAFTAPFLIAKEQTAQLGLAPLSLQPSTSIHSRLC